VGGDYKLTPSFDLAAGFYNIQTYNRPEVGEAYWATAYSLLADYTLSQRFDTYAGIMAMQYNGVGLTKHAPIDAYSNNAMYGIGIRFRFRSRAGAQQRALAESGADADGYCLGSVLTRCSFA